MIVRLQVITESGIFYRDEDWFAPVPVPVVGDLILVGVSEYRVYLRQISVNRAGPWVTLELSPVKKPFIKAGWFIMEDPPSGEVEEAAQPGRQAG